MAGLKAYNVRPNHVYHLWWQRWHYAATGVAAGYNMLMLDADISLRADPYPLLRTLSHSHALVTIPPASHSASHTALHRTSHHAARRAAQRAPHSTAQHSTACSKACTHRAPYRAARRTPHRRLQPDRALPRAGRRPRLGGWRHRSLLHLPRRQRRARLLLCRRRRGAVGHGGGGAARAALSAQHTHTAHGGGRRRADGPMGARPLPRRARGGGLQLHTLPPLAAPWLRQRPINVRSS